MNLSNASKLASLLALLGAATIGCADPTSSDEATGEASSAAVVIEGASCATLYAGQTINAGSVCTSVVGDDLIVTYTTTNGWQLMGAHLWVGEAMTTMPQTSTGNPKIGNFPYNAGALAGVTSYAFTVSLASIGGEPYVCDRAFHLAAHAVVRRPNGDGTFNTQTGWGAGTSITTKGSWATYSTVTLACVEEQPPTEQVCETAFAKGDTSFIDLGITTSRWGWELGPVAPGTYQAPLYAGAGQNDLSKGVNVGTLYYSYDGASVTVTYTMFSGYTMSETHLYVGPTHLETTAPGQFGNIHDLAGASTDTFSVGAFSGESLFMAAHAVVCH